MFFKPKKLISPPMKAHVSSSEEEHVCFPDERPLLKTLEFFEISHSSYQPLNFLSDLSLST